MSDNPISPSDVSADLPDGDKDRTPGLADPQRLLALGASDVLASAANPTFDRAVKLASRLLDAPTSLVAFVDSERQHFKAQVGLNGPAADARGTPLSHSFCKHVVSSGEPLVVSDARIDPLLKDNAAIVEMRVVAYLGIPIHAPGGEVLGSFCVIDSAPRAWTPSDLETLQDLTRMVEMELSLQDAVSQRDIVLQEMNHRIKNLFSLVGSMIRLEKRNHDSLESFVQSLTARIGALDAAHKMIVPVVSAHLADGHGATLGDLMDKILKPHADVAGANVVLAGDTVHVGPRATVYLTLAIHELATNAAKYGGLSVDDGRLDVSWSVTGEAIDILWTETGMIWKTGPWEHKTSGFGSRLLAISIEGQLGGVLTTEVKAAQLQHRITLPFSGLEH